MYKTNWFGVACIAALLFIFGNLFYLCIAEVRLAHVFSSHMVLQQEKPITIWGWANPNEVVTVQLLSQTQETKANDRGEWKPLRCLPEGGGPYIAITGSNVVKLEDVMVGEVWLCSGQSNMEMGMGMINDAQQEIAAADHPEIRLLLVTRKWSPEPQKDIDGTWKICSPQSVSQGGWNGFSAAAYFFGRELHQQLKVPIGLIESSWGGTRIESWTLPRVSPPCPLKYDSDILQFSDPQSAALSNASPKPLMPQSIGWMPPKRPRPSMPPFPPCPLGPGELHGPNDLQQATAPVNHNDSLVPFAN